MLLKRLELSGFKSFARTTTLEFTAPVTAVVGPNGSGKSNIVEAMRFVLGEQSMKSLRGKRGEDLIFHGSKSLARQNRASVTVVFDNTTHAFPIDYDEVEIKRAVYRDGANQYFINGSRARLKDILELLASVHIGAGSHHIISQGETDHILAASIQERRGMIEDALGLKVYHYKLSESERKLQKTKENIAQTEALRAEVASHLNFLEKQVDKIRQAETMRVELAALYQEYFRGEKLYLNSLKEGLLKEHGDPRHELDDTRKKIKEKSAEQESKPARKQESKETELEEKMRGAQKDKDALSRALGRVEGAIEYAEREMARRKKEDGTIAAFPQSDISAFVEIVRRAAEEAERLPDLESLKAVLRAVKEKIILFFKRERWSPDGVSEENLANLYREKEETARTLYEAEEKEKSLASGFAALRQSMEEALGAERLIEKELFLLRTKENELATQRELYLYREGRLKEEAARVREETAEAGYLLGTQALRFDEGGAPDGAPPERKEQERRRQKIERLKIRIEETGSGGTDILKEYGEVKERDGFLAKETNDLLATAESLEKLNRELSERIDTEFKEGVLKINEEFQSIFSAMFGGGSASLSVVAPAVKKKKAVAEDELLSGDGSTASSEEEEEAEEGIDISVNLPAKRVKGLQVLSGGERSLTSIALVFAITLVNPPPFLILDETDAALDEANSEKYGELLLKLKDRTQFIIITHNRGTMTRAGVLYGVTSGADGASRILSVKLDEAEELAE